MALLLPATKFKMVSSPECMLVHLRLLRCRDIGSLNGWHQRPVCMQAGNTHKPGLADDCAYWQQDCALHLQKYGRPP